VKPYYDDGTVTIYHGRDVPPLRHYNVSVRPSLAP
jgi:hypothetical protein